MTDRYFHLFPGEGEQTLLLSRSLTGIHKEPGFAEFIERFGVTATPKPKPESELMLEELIISPPIQRVNAFAKAIIAFAVLRSERYFNHQDSIAFMDYTLSEDGIIVARRP